MDDPTEEEIARILRKETSHVSATLTSISRTGEPTVSPDRPTTTSDIDLSGLVELRVAHETLQARNSARNSKRIAKEMEGDRSVTGPSEFGRARREIVLRFHQLLRDADAEGERVGTGLHRNYNWTGGNGNALNAEKAAESRANQVCI